MPRKVDDTPRPPPPTSAPQSTAASEPAPTSVMDVRDEPRDNVQPLATPLRRAAGLGQAISLPRSTMPTNVAGVGEVPRIPTPVAADSAQNIRKTPATLHALTAADFSGAWAAVRASLHAAIPEAAFLNGPAAESAEAGGSGTGPQWSASRELYGEYWVEADRAWGGLQALHAVYQGTREMYDWTIQSQSPGEKLSWESYQALHRELRAAAPDDASLRGLIWGVLCNDLGKTEAIGKLYQQSFNEPPPDHDRMMGELLSKHPQYFPAFMQLGAEEREALAKGFSCGCDIAQLCQLEIAPGEMEGFRTLTPAQRKLYVLHSKYDVAGAAITAKPGAVTLRESTFKEFRALEVALAGFTDTASTHDVYEGYIARRAQMIGLSFPLSSRQRLTTIVAAMTRKTEPWQREGIELVLNDPGNAGMCATLENHLGSMLHIYYGPALLLSAESNLRKQLEAPPSPRGAFVDGGNEQRFDPTYAQCRQPTFDRAYVEGLWMGLSCLAQSIDVMMGRFPAALGTIPDTTGTRQLDVGDLARALKRVAIAQVGRPLPALNLQSADMGADVAIIDPHALRTMSELSRSIAQSLGVSAGCAASFALGLRALPDVAQDILSEAFMFDGDAQMGRWKDAGALYNAMSEHVPKMLEPTEFARRFLTVLAQCAWASQRVREDGIANTSQIDLSQLIADPTVCTAGGMVTMHTVADALEASIKPHRNIALNHFERTRLEDIPGRNIVCIGIGGSDGLTSAQIATQLGKVGKTIAAVVSVRGSTTGSPGVNEGGYGVQRVLDHVIAEVAAGVYRVGKNTHGPGRMFENLAADDVPMHVLIDDPAREVKAQLEALLAQLGPVDTIVVVNTSGRVFNAVGQESRVLRAIGHLDGYDSLTAVLPLQTSEHFEAQARRAGALFIKFDDDQVHDILTRLRQWGLDGRNPERWGNGPFTWNVALQARGSGQTTVMPYPSWIVNHPRQPRSPFKAVEESMGGMFVMPTRKVLEQSDAARAALKGTPEQNSSARELRN